jgi:hypothetical protein
VFEWLSEWCMKAKTDPTEIERQWTGSC